MTKTLAEKWREGTLPSGEYYIKLDDGSFTTDKYFGKSGGFAEEIPVEVLAPVPSYDKVKEMSQKIERLEFDNEVLDNELKELATKNDTFAMENGRLQKRLEIAAKALKEYDNKLNWDIRGVSFMKYNKGFTIARKALKEMEGVK